MITLDECFLLFELTPSCSKEDLKSAYKRLVSKHHPDRGGNTSLFQCIQYAYTEINKYINATQQTTLINVSVDMTLEEIISGKSILVTVNIDGDDRELLVDVPPGVKNGQRILVKNVSAGKDVCVSIKEISHPFIKRVGTDLHVAETISVFEAMTGTKKQVHVFDSVVEINIPPGCENNKTFTFSGLKTYNGKIVITVHYNAPAITSPSHIALLMSLQSSLTSP